MSVEPLDGATSEDRGPDEAIGPDEANEPDEVVEPDEAVESADELLADEEHAGYERDVQQTFQSCIDDVMLHRGGSSVTEIMAELREALAAAGHQEQPREWVRAVSEEMAAGHRYVMGTSARHLRTPPDATG